MKRLTFYLSLAALYSVSLLPFWFLYLLSDALYFVLFHILKYRREVVLTNLRNSFPEKDEVELKQIQQKFYKHLCDITVESVKSFSISESATRKRCRMVNPEIFQPFFDRGQNVVVLTGHFNNWEWAALSSPIFSPHEMYAVFLPLRNPHFNEFIMKNRSRFGGKLVRANAVSRELAKPKSKPYMLVFVADQAPSNLRRSHWMEFLSQPTAVNPGPEKVANLANLPVLLGIIEKRKRGHYEIRMEVLEPEPSSCEPFEITERYMKRLEGQIQQHPEQWLWSHRRWKHKKPEDGR